MRALVDAPRRYVCVLEAVNFVDSSFAIKFGVQFNLFGGTILNLGTTRHEKYLGQLDRFEIVRDGNRSVVW